MKRRHLLLTSLATSRLAGAQGLRLPRIGMLSIASNADPVAFIHIRSYLAALGWREGQTVTIAEHHGEGDTRAAPQLAAAMLAQRPDVIVVTGTTETQAVQAATSQIPTVFIQVVDPVALGFAAGLARPGGNITGVAAAVQALWGKRIEILAELLPPDRRRLSVLTNPTNASHRRNLPEIMAQAAGHGFAPLAVPLSEPAGMAAALELAARQDAALVPHDVILFPRRRQVAAWMAEARLPAIYENRFSPIVGGMASYGADLRDNYRQAALYVDRILRGARPADLPIVQPTRVKFVLNAPAVAALGLSLPPLLLARIDEVIE